MATVSYQVTIKISNDVPFVHDTDCPVNAGILAEFPTTTNVGSDILTEAINRSKLHLRSRTGNDFDRDIGSRFGTSLSARF